MAISAATVWESRPSVGNSTNGGGFVAGATGTDFSQQNAKNTGASDKSTADAVANGTTTITSATANFTAAIVGNIIYLAGGTGAIAAVRVQVTGFTNSTTITIDSTVLASTGMTMNIGGALASVSNAIGSAFVAGNTIYSKNTGVVDGFFLSITMPAGSVTLPNLWEGYNATRGDLATADWANTHTTAGFLDMTNFPVLNPSANAIVFSGATTVRCIKFMSARTFACVTASNSSNFYRCAIIGSAVGAVSALTVSAGRSLVSDCDLSTVGQSGTSVLVAADTDVHNCRITSTSGGGISVGSSGGISVYSTLFYTMALTETAVTVTGANTRVSIVNCTFYNILGTCVTLPNLAQTTPAFILINNQVTGCGTFVNNLRSATQVIPVQSIRNRIRDTPILYVGFSNVGIKDITTAQTDSAEYTNAVANDFTLQVAAAGVGQGYPSYLDTGFAQRQEAVASYPSSSDVRLGISFGSGLIGSLDLPVDGDVRNGVQYDGLTQTGTLLVPSAVDVRSGTNFDSGGSSLGILDLPSIDDVRFGTVFDQASKTGDLVLPTTIQVLSGVQYGTNGTEFTGTASAGGSGLILGG